MVYKWLDKKIYKCERCSNKFTRKEIYKSFFDGKPIICSSCNTKHYLRLLTRSLFSFSPTFPLFVRIFVDYRNPLLVYIIWILIAILIIPFYARYYTKFND